MPKSKLYGPGIVITKFVQPSLHTVSVVSNEKQKQKKMCIISGEVRKVSGTNIFVGKTQDGKRQFTVYSNTVSMQEQRGTMILPFPRGPCELVDLTDYKTLFHDLAAVCPVEPVVRAAYSVMSNCFKSDARLEVKQVGSYKASLMPSLRDVPRLDTNVFPVKANVVAFLQQNYPDHLFSFVVCRLDAEATYHPFGYIHPVLLPSTRDGKSRLFVPTLHYHEHERHTAPMERHTAESTAAADWDHSIWCLNSAIANLVKQVRANTQSDHAHRIQWHKLPALERCHTVTGYRIRADYAANHDLAALGIG